MENPETTIYLSEPTKLDNQVATEVEKNSHENRLEQHKTKIKVGIWLGAAALAFNEMGTIKDQVVESAHWTAPMIVAAETVATTGLAAMMAATGDKIGNPLTLRNRLKGKGLGDLKLRDRLSKSRLFRAGAYLNLAGASATSTVIATETIDDLPVNAWPASLGVAGLSVALSLPFYRIARGRSREETS